MILTAKPSDFHTVDQTCSEALQLANFLQHAVEFTYAGVTITAYSGNMVEDLVAEYKAKGGK